MSSKIYSAALIGLDAEIVEVECDIASGPLGAFVIVGLPDMAVSESRERVRMAIKNSGYDFSKRKVAVNLAPADLRKQGPSYDLPIAVSVLIASGQFESQIDYTSSLFIGELSLSGDLRGVNGVLSIALSAHKKGFKTIYVPKENAREAKLVKDLQVVGISSLRELIFHLSGKKQIEETEYTDLDFYSVDNGIDISHVRGQDHAKRALEIAAAGAHNILLYGPPGSGKTMLARSIVSILPFLTINEALEVTKIYSIAGQLSRDISLVRHRPFRSPHHTASSSALVGGGSWPRPGEISLAHRGVLFLDEFGEFPRQMLENLRQPLEDGIINVSRAAGNLTFPAKFILVAAMNPCPCGYYGDDEKSCSCSPSQIVAYKKKISGPIMDRIDMHIEVARLQFEKLEETSVKENSQNYKERIETARTIQQDRFANLNIITNSEMSSEQTKKFCELDASSISLLRSAVDKLHLSARSYFRILKLARSIADLSASEKINENHIAEALQYRPKID